MRFRPIGIAGCSPVRVGRRPPSSQAMERPRSGAHGEGLAERGPRRTARALTIGQERPGLCLRLPGDAPMVNGSRPDCPTPGGPLRTGFPDHDRQMTTFARSVDPPSGGYLGETTRTQHRYRWPPLCERVERTIGKFRITVGKSATGRSGVGCRRLYGGAVKEKPPPERGPSVTRGGGPGC